MSTDVEFDEYDEEAFQIISQVLETYARPSKRRRVSSSTNTPDDEDIIDSKPELPSSRNASNRSNRGSLSLDEDDSAHEAGDKAREKAAQEPKKKKPKHLIHIPKVHRQYKETFQYGTQVADGEPGSSPCMARGARWKLPNPQHRETDNQQTKFLAQKSGTTLEAFFKPLALKEVDSNRTITNRRPANSISAEQNSTEVSLYDNDEEDDESTNIPSLRDNPSARTDSSSGKAKSTPGKSFPSDLKTASSARNLSKDLETFDIPSDIDDEFDSLPKTAPNSNASSRSKERRSTRPSGPSDVDYAKELAEIGSDFFSSSPEECEITRQRLVAPQTNLRQTTLFGERVAGAQVAASQVNMVRQYRQDIPPEPPSHHKMDLEAMKTWVYPTNLGQIRDYQYSIVKTGLFSNTLVALPTGLGKTFIAATIMLNYYRWFPDAQIVFMAPTKPLVSQQVDACFNVAGIPRSVTTMLNGEVKIDLREEEWANKRVFFMTPQTLEKDISSGRADPKRIVLMVIDEAHKATGKFAYVKCIEKVRAFSKSFRVLALTATPGSTVEKVQEVVDSLEIAKVEIRTEASIDIQPFVYHRNIDEIILQPSDEMNEITSLFSKVLQPLVNILCSQKAFYNSDPMSLTSFGVVQSVREWVASPAGRGAGEGLKNQMRSVSAILASIAHSIKLLKFHGMSPFYANLKAFRDGVEEKGEKGSKYKKQIVNSGDFKEMMNHLQSWTATDDFIGHPKITVLCDTILNHFMDAGEGTNAAESSTKVMVFSEFRDSADTLLTELLKHRPMVRPSIFVGQADSGRSAGMKQSQQGQVIKDFKTGKFNVLVATCIGEEGLDIGEIDLIICYDCSASPIRMLQRMGRTGRKRAGRIVLLMMEGKEHDNFAKAKDNYENMQELISDGRQFAFRNDLSTRIVPRDIKPEVDKRVVDIPFENTQNPALPVPRAKGRGVAKNKTAKKFHMPDGVIIGFQKASKMVDGGDMAKPKVKRARRTQQEIKRDAELATAEKTLIPKLDSILLTSAEEKELELSFQSVGGNAWDQEVLPPDLTKYPQHQRKPRPTFRIGHSRTTKDFISTLQKMHSISQSTLDEWDRIYAAYPDVAMEASSAERDALGEETLDEDLLDNSIAVESDEHDESDGEAAHLQNVHSSGPRGSIALGSDTEGEDPDDDQDNDLPDFVVNDDLEEEKSQVSSPITISSPYTAADTTRRKPFYEVTEFPATQDTDDGLPDITALVRKRKRESPPRRTSASEVLRGWGRKRPVFDDDSDE